MVVLDSRCQVKRSLALCNPDGKSTSCPSCTCPAVRSHGRFGKRCWSPCSSSPQPPPQRTRRTTVTAPSCTGRPVVCFNSATATKKCSPADEASLAPSRQPCRWQKQLVSKRVQRCASCGLRRQPGGLASVTSRSSSRSTQFSLDSLISLTMLPVRDFQKISCCFHSCDEPHARAAFGVLQPPLPRPLSHAERRVGGGRLCGPADCILVRCRPHHTQPLCSNPRQPAPRTVGRGGEINSTVGTLNNTRSIHSHSNTYVTPLPPSLGHLLERGPSGAHTRLIDHRLK